MILVVAAFVLSFGAVLSSSAEVVPVQALVEVPEAELDAEVIEVIQALVEEGTDSFFADFVYELEVRDIDFLDYGPRQRMDVDAVSEIVDRAYELYLETVNAHALYLNPVGPHDRVQITARLRLIDAEFEDLLDQLGDSSEFLIIQARNMVNFFRGNSASLIEPILAKRITRLVIGGYEGEIDDEEMTITFTIPLSARPHGSFLGTINVLETELGHDEVIFLVGGTNWPRSVGQDAGFSQGDLVFVLGGDIRYTIQFVDVGENLDLIIREITVGAHAGVVDQDDRTITFIIPREELGANDSFGGILFHLDADGPVLEIYVGGQWWARSLGQVLAFHDGDLVAVTGGKVYTLVIEVIEPAPVEILPILQRIVAELNQAGVNFDRDAVLADVELALELLEERAANQVIPNQELFDMLLSSLRTLQVSVPVFDPNMTNAQFFFDFFIEFNAETSVMLYLFIWPQV